MFCFCGDDPYRYGPENVTDNYIMDSDCNSKCIGDPEQICGGVWRLSVYKSGMLTDIRIYMNMFRTVVVSSIPKLMA